MRRRRFWSIGLLVVALSGIAVGLWAVEAFPWDDGQEKSTDLAADLNRM
jgi:hypothetical protein